MDGVTVSDPSGSASSFHVRNRGAPSKLFGLGLTTPTQLPSKNILHLPLKLRSPAEEFAPRRKGHFQAPFLAHSNEYN